MNDAPQRTDPEERKADARDARDLLGDRIFLKAIVDLRKAWFGELMITPDGTERKLELVAKLQALEAIPLQLNSYVNNEKVVQDGRRRQ